MKHRRSAQRNRQSQAGQSFLVVVVFIAVVLLGVMGIAIDYSQVWAHRQMAQGAADAACQAAAADLWLFALGTTPSGGTTWFSSGTAFDCSSNTASSPCKYASYNGYSGSAVAVSFPSSLPGVTALPGSLSISHPYVEVKITDPVPMSLSKLLGAPGNFSMTAKAGCGVVLVNQKIPLMVLNKTQSGTLSNNGTPNITIIGGPERSIQVDSSSTTAVNLVGSSLIDLGLAGPHGNFGVVGKESQPSQVTFTDAGTGTSNGGKWISPTSPIGDPFATQTFPSSAPGTAGTAFPVPLGVNGCPDPNGCVEFTAGSYSGCATGSIAPGAKGCINLPYTGSNPGFNAGGANWQAGHAYTAGQIIQPAHPPCANTANSGGYLYIATTSGTSSGTCPATFAQTPCQWQTNGTCTPTNTTTTTTDGTVTWQNVGKVTLNKLGTAIFDPGLYYIDSHGLTFGSNSAARMSTAVGDGSKGATFYFSSSGTVSFAANSGNSSGCTSATNIGGASPNGCIVTYAIAGGRSSVATGAVPFLALQCPGGPANPTQVPATIDGNILLGPCSGTYGDPAGQNRGFLFAQNRSVSASPSLGGGAGYIFSGFVYFHSGNGATCGTNTSCLSLQGGTSSNSYALGNIVVDEISLGGNSSIKMILNSNETFPVMKPSLLE